MMKHYISQQRLQDILWYRHDTGQFFWRLDRSRVKAGDRAGCAVKGRWQILLEGHTYQAPRLAWLYVNGVMPDGRIIPIDGDHMNMRVENWRLQHAQSQPRQHNVTQCPGVTWSPRDNKWLANITSNGKKKYLGLFTDHADAVTARKAAEVLRQIPAPPALDLPAPPHLPTSLW
jgi:hypothetical protein